MKKNIIPFAIIAIIGVFAIIIVSSIGVSQRADIQNEDENGGETEEAVVQDPDEIFANSCASCHGGDLTGGAGPDLTSVGADKSEDEIHDIILNGADGMPPGLIQGEEADQVAAWLSEMK